MQAFPEPSSRDWVRDYYDTQGANDHKKEQMGQRREVAVVPGPLAALSWPSIHVERTSSWWGESTVKGNEL